MLFRSGFVETYKLKYEATEESKLTWVDANSLYSYIALTCNLPIGGFVTLTYLELKNNCKLNLTDGQFYFKGESMICDIALVEILAPSHLQAPFISYCVKDEFVFMANCKRCATEKLSKPCKHSSKDRSFTSTWTCLELSYAVFKLGYVILNWYEVHHYKSFAPLLSDFVKILGSEKLKNSNVLANISDPIAQDNYCKFLNNAMGLEHEACQLTCHNCTNNSAAKSYYKNCLNSLYHRFALHLESILVSINNVFVNHCIV